MSAVLCVCLQAGSSAGIGLHVACGFCWKVTSMCFASLQGPPSNTPFGEVLLLTHLSKGRGSEGLCYPGLRHRSGSACVGWNPQLDPLCRLRCSITSMGPLGVRKSLDACRASSNVLHTLAPDERGREVLPSSGVIMLTLSGGYQGQKWGCFPLPTTQRVTLMVKQ